MDFPVHWESLKEQLERKGLVVATADFEGTRNHMLGTAAHVPHLQARLCP